MSENDVQVDTLESSTPYAPGARIFARDEEWLVRSAVHTDHDGYLIKAVGVSELVQDEPITLFDKLEPVELVRPEETRLVRDDTPKFRRSRLFLESLLRRTPLPRSERGLALADGFLLNPLPYQQRPAELALKGIRPRILIADVVGLGKTLEIGLVLAELIRRGRGERILVATPQHVLEQFQRELWTRFSIPLVRLDSLGIERIQREIPAGRNPFSHFKRVIVSIDTLKDSSRYGHHLENTRWDAVVIDESHNLIGATTQRNKLARLLASQTDALLLASATPHNGDKRSFAELIRLLDPAAIADPNDYRSSDIEHLYIRRTKVSQEVQNHLAGKWAERGPSTPIRCAATNAEEKVFAEFAETWLAGADRDGGPVVDRQNRLFPYTLLKAFLSSHVALEETVSNRLKSPKCTDERERRALTTLHDRVSEIRDEDSAKLAELVNQLRERGIGPTSATRIVVFSERIPTLNWLARVVPEKLGLKPEAVRILHGGLPDQQQQRIVEEFELAGSPVRLLLTGDVASEGVNLHRACHQMIHYDLPWSLIRIEQRNGRIDRYGQTENPQFAALILSSSTTGAKDDTTVAEKLLEREAEVHRSLGSAEAVTGEYLADREERRLMEDLLKGKSVEEAVEPAEERDVLADLLADVGTLGDGPDPQQVRVPSLFGSTSDFVGEAFQELYRDPETELNLAREDDMIAFNAPPDLEQRLSDLPASYLAAQRVNGTVRLKLTFDAELAQRKLDETRQKKQTSWPDLSYVSEVHPLLDWLADKTLVRLGRKEALVVLANVDEPVFLVQGVYCNQLGQPTVVEWMALSGLPGSPVIESLDQALRKAEVKPGMANPKADVDIEELEKLVPEAIAAARGHLEQRRAEYDESIVEPLRSYRDRVDAWEQLALEISTSRSSAVSEAAATQRQLIAELETTGQPLLRLLAVVERAR